MRPKVSAGMVFQFNNVVLILVLAGFVAGAPIVHVLRRRELPGRLEFVLLMGAISMWALTAAVEMACVGLSTKIFVSKFQYVGVSSVAVFWLAYVLRYSHHDTWLTPFRKALLAVIPLVTIALVFTNEHHGLVWSAIVPEHNALGSVARFEHGPAVWVIMVYSYVLLAVGTGVLSRFVFRAPNIYRWQAVLLIGAAVVPWVGNAIYLAGLSPLGIDLTPLSFTVSVVFLTVNMMHFHFLDVVPVAHDTLFAAMHDGVLVLDAMHRLVDINPAGLKILGMTNREVGQPVEDVLRGWPDLAAITQPGEADCVGELCVTSPEGRRWFEWRRSTVRERHRMRIGYVLVVHDISPRRQAQEDKLRLEQQLLQTQKLESLGLLAGGIAHDFNNLLTVILGNIDLALAELPSVDAAKTDLIEAERAGRRAAELIGQLLAYSGQGRFRIEPIDLNDLLSEMVRMLEVTISKKGSLNLRLAGDLPAVMADATQMRQVIMNLVINAAESLGGTHSAISLFTGVQHCDRHLLSSLLLPEALPEGRYVRLAVKDNGCGMDAVTLARVFDPFFTTKAAGRGLGLAAVLGIVRGHKGGLRVESEPGKGSLFEIFLPAAAVEKSETVGSTPDLTAWRGQGLVVLVDDEERVRALGKRMLERMGFTVEMAGTGEEAVGLFQRKPDPVVCVLMDMIMPGMGGADAADVIRRMRPEVRIVMISGYTEQTIEERSSERAFDGFLQKPFTQVELMLAIRKALG